ncbi:DUF4142 domain-containing protein [Pedobacter yulinensis]|nr:DUF4142 domain-containing protein [Pedobacter yulinensis]
MSDFYYAGQTDERMFVGRPSSFYLNFLLMSTPKINCTSPAYPGKGPFSQKPRAVGAADNDRMFLLEEYRLRISELSMSRFVLEKGEDPETCTLAGKLTNDHQHALLSLSELAASASITLPRSSAGMIRTQLRALSQFQPQQLTRYFILHQRVMLAWSLPLFKCYSSFAENVLLRGYAQHTVTALHAHVPAIEQLCRRWQLDT